MSRKLLKLTSNIEKGYVRARLYTPSELFSSIFSVTSLRDLLQVEIQKSTKSVLPRCKTSSCIEILVYVSCVKKSSVSHVRIRKTDEFDLNSWDDSVLSSFLSTFLSRLPIQEANDATRKQTWDWERKKGIKEFQLIVQQLNGSCVAWIGSTVPWLAHEVQWIARVGGVQLASSYDSQLTTSKWASTSKWAAEGAMWRAANCQLPIHPALSDTRMSLSVGLRALVNK